MCESSEAVWRWTLSLLTLNTFWVLNSKSDKDRCQYETVMSQYMKKPAPFSTQSLSVIKFCWTKCCVKWHKQTCGAVITDIHTHKAFRKQKTSSFLSLSVNWTNIWTLSGLKSTLCTLTNRESASIWWFMAFPGGQVALLVASCSCR